MNEGIAEGIKFAMSRGETLQQAMQSFYNAGYSKEEVEEAAKAMQYQLYQEKAKGIHAVHPEFEKPAQNPIQNSVQKLPQEKTETGNSIAPSIQKVSSYDSETQGENPRRKMIIFVSVLLLVLAIAFAGIFFFRNSLLGMFNSILG